MQELLNKYREIEAEVAREKGEFSLFALLQREDAFGGKWDLVVAAPWIGEGRLKTLNYLADKITSRLTIEELLSLSMVVPVSVTDEPVQRLIREYPVTPDQKPIEIRDWDYRGMPIARGYILTARLTPAAAATSKAAAAG
jgi:hypothetical protein